MYREPMTIMILLDGTKIVALTDGVRRVYQLRRGPMVLAERTTFEQVFRIAHPTQPNSPHP